MKRSGEYPDRVKDSTRSPTTHEKNFIFNTGYDSLDSTLCILPCYNNLNTKQNTSTLLWAINPKELNKSSISLGYSQQLLIPSNNRITLTLGKYYKNLNKFLDSNSWELLIKDYCLSRDYDFELILSRSFILYKPGSPVNNDLKNYLGNTLGLALTLNNYKELKPLFGFQSFLTVSNKISLDFQAFTHNLLSEFTTTKLLSNYLAFNLNLQGGLLTPLSSLSSLHRMSSYPSIYGFKQFTFKNSKQSLLTCKNSHYISAKSSLTFNSPWLKSFGISPFLSAQLFYMSPNTFHHCKLRGSTSIGFAAKLSKSTILVSYNFKIWSKPGDLTEALSIRFFPNWEN